MKSPHQITDDEIRSAEWINAVDPATDQCEIVWGLDEDSSTETLRPHGSILDVALSKENSLGLLNLMDRIERLRGRLPPSAQVLRENLKIATLLRPIAYSDEDVAIPDYFRG